MRVPRRFEAIVFVTHPRRTFRRCHATVCRDAFARMINNRATPVLARDSLAQSGIEKWTVDTRRMTMTFYDKAGREMLVEQIR